MNSATLEYIRTHPDASPKEIVAALAANFATVKDIDRKAMAAYLISNGIVLRFDAALASLPVELAGGIQLLQKANDWGLDYFGTSDVTVAAQVVGLAGGLTQEGVLKPEEFDAVIALGGGFRYDHDLTEAEVQAELDAYAAEQADESARAADQAVKQAMRSWLHNGYNSILAAIETGATDKAELLKRFEV